MTANLRNIGSTDPTLFSANALAGFGYVYFLRFDFATPLRLTTFPGGYTGDVDGTGSKTWTNDRPIVIGSSSQGMTSPLSVDQIALGDADNFWFAKALIGIADVPVKIWKAWMKTDGTLADFLPFYFGEIDAGESDGDSGEIFRIALHPHLQSFTQQTPSGTFTDTAFPLKPAEGIQIAFGSTTRQAPGDSSITSPAPPGYTWG